jgi:hypothetical protein
MFEPENELERNLVRATGDPAYRPAFMRLLMDAEIFLVLLPVGATITAGADGDAVIPPGTKLQVGTVQQGEQAFIPFFTAPSRARVIFTDERIVASDKTRDAFDRYPDMQFVLNPGSDYGKEFLIEEIKRLLSGDFGGPMKRAVIDKASEALLTSPSPYPAEVAAALTTLFAGMPAVKAAYLGQITLAGDTHLLIAVDSDVAWEALMDELSPRLPGILPKDRIIDFAPLAGGPFENHFRPQTPFFVRQQIT